MPHSQTSTQGRHGIEPAGPHPGSSYVRHGRQTPRAPHGHYHPLTYSRASEVHTGCTQGASSTLHSIKVSGNMQHPGKTERVITSHPDRWFMKFSITLDDDLIKQIEEKAAPMGISKAKWIRQACTQAATRSGGDEHPENPERVQYLISRVEDLTNERDWLRGQVALLTTQALPPPRAGFWNKLFGGKQE